MIENLIYSNNLLFWLMYRYRCRLKIYLTVTYEYECVYECNMRKKRYSTDYREYPKMTMEIFH